MPSIAGTVQSGFLEQLGPRIGAQGMPSSRWDPTVWDPTVARATDSSYGYALSPWDPVQWHPTVARAADLSSGNGLSR